MRIFLNNEIFIKRAIAVHGNRYDYSLVDYKTSKTKVKIICPEHGIFEQIPSSHLKGSGCSKCARKLVGNKNRLTTNKFINKAKEIHGDRYDYSLVNYKGTDIKVEIICPKHGKYKQTPHDHLSGSGCPKCGVEFTIQKESSNTEEFIRKAKEIHGDKYDYSLVDYKGNKDKVKIICPKHGEYIQRPNDHLNGSGCPKCGFHKSNQSKYSNTEEFIRKAKQVHDDKYDYSLTSYLDSNNKVKIICPKHGGFMQMPTNHLMGQGCPICKTSKGEKKIRKILLDNNINFIQQKTFSECRNKKVLPFDFYLPDINLLIEYDGILHFKAIEHYGGEEGLLYRKQNDMIKNKFAKDNNIDLIRISYKDDIDKKLNDKLLL